MHEERDLARGGQPEQAEDFGARFMRQVGDAESDAGSAFVEAAAHAVQDLAEFLRRGGALHRAVAGQQRTAIVHHRDARGNIAAGSAEVDQRAPLALRVPTRDGVDADLEFERRRDAVARLETVVLRRLSVRMQVDKSGGNHQALGIDGVACRERRRRDGRDLAAADPDVAHRVEIAGRIQHAPVGDDDIVSLREKRNSEEYEGETHHAEIVAARHNIFMPEAIESDAREAA